MKKIKFLAAAFMLAVCTTATAQFSNAKGGASTTTSVDTEGWSTLYIQYNPSTFSIDEKGADDFNANAVSFGFNRAFGLSNSTPLFIETGLGLQYTWSDDQSTDDEDIKVSMLSFKIPVDLIYKFQIPNSSIAIMPYAGLNLRINAWGEQKIEEKDDDDDDRYRISRAGYYDDDDDYYYGNDKDKLNLFDKKDMGKDYVWKRFQIGWHAGVKAKFGKSFMAGVGYGSDFSEICKKTTIGEWTIQLGYTF